MKSPKFLMVTVGLLAASCNNDAKRDAPAPSGTDTESGTDTVPPHDETGEPSETETGLVPPDPVDEDGDGVTAEDDCDDADPELGARADDTDCDGVPNEWDQIDGDDAQLHGIGFQDPVGTDWNWFMGEIVWTAHADFVADLNVDEVGSARRYLMRGYSDLDWVTEVAGNTLNWRADGDEAIAALDGIDPDTFTAHVLEMETRLTEYDAQKLAEMSEEAAAIAQSPMQIYGIDAEVSLWDRRWFYELATATFEMAYCAEMGQPYPYANSSYLFFERTGTDDAPVYTPNHFWTTLGEAHIRHMESAKALLGHEMVSIYGGPWSVNYVDVSRAVYRADLPPDRLAAVVTDAMLRVADMPLETGTMQRFIDAMGMNGTAWYPPMHNTWERNDDRWGQLFFDAQVAGLAAASNIASPYRPKGALWFHTGRLETFDNRVIETDARFTNRLWPDADPTLANFELQPSAVWIPDRLGSTQEGVTGTYPLPGGVVRYMAEQLKAHQLYAFGFLPVGSLRTDRSSSPGTIAGWNAVVFDDERWHRTEPLLDLDTDSHAWIVSVYYEYLLSGLRNGDE